MCAYEQLLFVVYHDSVPLFGNQIMKGRLFDIELSSLIEEVDITLSIRSSLIWIGFSEGMFN